MAYDTNTKKIDDLAVDGLLGVNNSLAYKVHEIEKHFHNREYWYGANASPVQGVTAGENGGVTPYIATSIATGDGWGPWLAIFGTGDTPALVGNVKFDLHRMEITDVGAANNKKPHFIQLSWSTLDATNTDEVAGDDGITNGDHSGFITIPEKDGKAAAADVLMPRIAVGTRLLFRFRCTDINTPYAFLAGTGFQFFVGIHEYVG